EPGQRVLGPHVPHDLDGTPGHRGDELLDGAWILRSEARGAGAGGDGALVCGGHGVSWWVSAVGTVSSCPGRSRSGSVPITSRLASWRRGQAAATSSGSGCAGPSRSSEMLHRLSPGCTTTVCSGSDSGSSAVSAPASVASGGSAVAGAGAGICGAAASPHPSGGSGEAGSRAPDAVPVPPAGPASGAGAAGESGRASCRGGGSAGGDGVADEG